MSKEKGFTLIEVIVSLAIIGLIALAVLPSLANHYKWIVDTKTNITDKAFAAQETMEDNINSIKNFISDTGFSGNIDSTDFSSMGITKKISNVELFNTQYPIASYANRTYPSAYQTEVSLSGNRIFKSWVSDKRIPGLAVPEIMGIALLLVQDGTESNGNLEYYNYPNLTLKAKSNMEKNPQNSFNRYRNDWYASKPGFMIPVQKIGFIDEDVDFGRIYPKFPDDYISTPFLSNLGSNYSYVSMTERNIVVTLANNYVNQYPGRHILYTITPFAKSLKMGSVSELLPVYIYGPDFTDDLVVHLDASTVDLSDEYDAISNINGAIYDNLYRFTRWKNNRLSLKTSNRDYDAIQKTYEDKMPVLKEWDITGTLYPEIPFQSIAGEDKVWGRVLGNKENNMSTMRIENIDLEDEMSIFMIMRKVDNPLGAQAGSIISATGDNPWSIGWLNDSGDLKLGFSSNNGTLALDTSLDLDQWYLIKATVNGSKKEIKAINLTNGVDQTLTGLVGDSSTDEIETDTIDINWNGIELSEILIYGDDISSSNLDKVENYLKNKYNP